MNRTTPSRETEKRSAMSRAVPWLTAGGTIAAVGATVAGGLASRKAANEAGAAAQTAKAMMRQNAPQIQAATRDAARTARNVRLLTDTVVRPLRQAKASGYLWRKRLGLGDARPPVDFSHSTIMKRHVTHQIHQFASAVREEQKSNTGRNLAIAGGLGVAGYGAGSTYRGYRDWKGSVNPARVADGTYSRPGLKDLFVSGHKANMGDLKRGKAAIAAKFAKKTVNASAQTTTTDFAQPPPAKGKKKPFPKFKKEVGKTECGTRQAVSDFAAHVRSTVDLAYPEEEPSHAGRNLVVAGTVGAAAAGGLYYRGRRALNNRTWDALQPGDGIRAPMALPKAPGVLGTMKIGAGALKGDAKRAGGWAKGLISRMRG